MRKIIEITRVENESMIKFFKLYGKNLNMTQKEIDNFINDICNNRNITKEKLLEYATYICNHDSEKFESENEYDDCISEIVMLLNFRIKREYKIYNSND